MTITQTSPAATLCVMPSNSPPPGSRDTATGHSHSDAPTTAARGGQDSRGRTASDAQKATAPAQLDPVLFVLADSLDDLERTRIANENRVRQLTYTGTDADGQMRGFGMDASVPQVAQLAGIVDALRKLEKQAERALTKHLRLHPLYPWITATVGVGEKQGARLLAAIGDPYWNTSHDRPRTVSQLWAYCGLHVLPGPTTQDAPPVQAASVPGVAAKRQRGVRANWSGTAKMRAYLVARSCMQQAASPYRSTYVGRRAHTAVTRPEWTPGHSHNDALRVTAKAVLRDLWHESRRIRNAAEQGCDDG